ncbi:thiamine pyrophosphate-dependent enzyme [Nocardioides limicola]|uniref:thiamine pyrophosphate-dependent enzyme n=1 Tax=Nocardioides limicola TaxID=2803368 RepID=UPI00193AEB22|nr:thiamine pyrophosphate-dependent enzyme [Nocardioides sp. DJM-14]
MDEVEQHFLQQLTAPVPGPTGPVATEIAAQLPTLFAVQAQSRHLDVAARWLQSRGDGFYTIGSAGHESNAALGLLTEVTDPALLHYRSGGFYAARAAVEGSTDPVRDVLRSLSCSTADPASGGRHKVWGHPRLHIIPQTSTIASHLPRAVGLAFALGLARALDRRTPWPADAIVVCSFGDASANHSTATGALNAAGYLTHVHRDCPVLFVCEDNGLGISTPTPRGWTRAALEHRPHLDYLHADGDDPVGLLQTTATAIEKVRGTRRPAVLHLRTVRFGGHAGSDVERAYRSTAAITADLAHDPLLATARTLIRLGLRSAEELREQYEEIRQRVMATAEEVRHEPRLDSRAAVMAPLGHVLLRPDQGGDRPPGPLPSATGGPGLTLAQAINRTLAQAMAEDAGVVAFGEDVAIKGGVYGVTRGLRARFGAERVFDTLLDEQTILGTALGTSLAGFLPIPEIQYLAYLHNAEDQLRGEAASLRFFSDGAYRNPMVVRVAGLAYQRGFGGHFHNDNSLAVLRDIPGLVVAVPSHPATAPGLLRGCLELARTEGRVCVVVEPIARYHTRDLFDGDEQWLAAYDDSSTFVPGEVTTYGDGRDLLLVTFGNGVHLSRRAAARLAADQITCTVLDLRWLAPLPMDRVLEAARSVAGVLVVDETRASGGVADALVAALVEAGCPLPIASVRSADSYVPLGPAAATVLLGEDEIVEAARQLAGRTAG